MLPKIFWCNLYAVPLLNLILLVDYTTLQWWKDKKHFHLHRDWKSHGVGYAMIHPLYSKYCGKTYELKRVPCTKDVLYETCNIFLFRSCNYVTYFSWLSFSCIALLHNFRIITFSRSLSNLNLFSPFHLWNIWLFGRYKSAVSMFKPHYSLYIKLNCY